MVVPSKAVGSAEARVAVKTYIEAYVRQNSLGVSLQLRRTWYTVPTMAIGFTAQMC